MRSGYMDKKIILYSTGCPKCEILKKKLALTDIQFEENNSMDEMLNLGIMQVPVLKVGDEYMDFRDAVHWINGLTKE